MGQLFETIRDLVARDEYVVGQHAVERLEERGILEWQVVASLDERQPILERPGAEPNPAVEVRQTLPNGTDIKAVWSLLKRSGVAKPVTVHFFDYGESCEFLASESNGCVGFTPTVLWSRWKSRL